MPNSVNINFQGGFSVLMALYYKDDPSLLVRAVDSVFKNSLTPNELVLVIDGPIGQNLEGVLEKLRAQYTNLRIIRLVENRGLATALNFALKEIKFPWVVRADADDINLPHRFATLAQAVYQNPGLQLLGSAMTEIDELGRPLTVREVPCTEKEILQFAKTRNPFNHMTVAYRLDAVIACGAYPNIFLKEDYGLWCHFLAKQLPVANIKEVLVHASAGMAMFRRRGGWRYAKSEWEMQLLLVRLGLKGKVRAILDGSMRAIFFLIPARIRGFLYTTLLRKSALD